MWVVLCLLTWHFFSEQLEVTAFILLLYRASILSMFLKRSAVLYLSSPLHCNHWFVPVGHHGWPSCVFYWLDSVGEVWFLVTLLLRLCFSLSFMLSIKNTSPFHIFLFLSWSDFSRSTGHPSPFQNEHKCIFSYLLSSVNCRIENGSDGTARHLFHCTNKSKITSAFLSWS